MRQNQHINAKKKKKKTKDRCREAIISSFEFFLFPPFSFKQESKAANLYKDFISFILLLKTEW